MGTSSARPSSSSGPTSTPLGRSRPLDADDSRPSLSLFSGGLTRDEEAEDEVEESVDVLTRELANRAARCVLEDDVAGRSQAGQCNILNGNSGQS